MAIDRNDGFRPKMNMYEIERKIKKYVKIKNQTYLPEIFHPYGSKASKRSTIMDGK